MTEIVKICKKHGELTINQVYQEKISNGISFYFRCTECRHEYEIKTKEKRLAYSREYEKNKRKRPNNHKDKAREYSKNWRRKNAALINNRVALDRKVNPEKYREYERKWRRENLLKARELDIINKYHMDYEQYKWMIERQNGLCEICNKAETRKSRSGDICRLNIDHNHLTGMIRDLLCHNCNVLVGHCMESEEIIDNTKLYLRKHKEKEKEYNRLFNEQEKKCAICKCESKLILDSYENDSNKFRGLLCINCLSYIRWAKGDVDKLKKSIEFISRYKLTDKQDKNGFYIWEMKSND